MLWRGTLNHQTKNLLPINLQPQQQHSTLTLSTICSLYSLCQQKNLHHSHLDGVLIDLTFIPHRLERLRLKKVNTLARNNNVACMACPKSDWRKDRKKNNNKQPKLKINSSHKINSVDCQQTQSPDSANFAEILC